MARKGKTRNPKLSVAIIGEGQTEWYYFLNMRKTQRFGFEVKPSMPKHSDFKTIIKTARKFRIEGYDLVFCVLDMDNILNNSSLKKQYLKEKSYNKHNSGIFFIETMPCFELWFLLHFTKKHSTKIFRNYREIYPELIKYIKNYQKSEQFFRDIGFYNHLETTGSIELAKRNAELLLLDKKKQDNPFFNYTHMHELFEQLKNMRKQYK